MNYDRQSMKEKNKVVPNLIIERENKTTPKVSK